MFDYFITATIGIVIAVLLLVILWLYVSYMEMKSKRDYLEDSCEECHSRLIKEYKKVYEKDLEIIRLKNQIAALEVRNEQQT